MDQFPPLPLRLATRGSPLARAQAGLVIRQLRQTHTALAEPEAIQTEIITTTGDRFLDQPLAEIGGKGLFTKEIDHALLTKAADIAVHSMKDVPTALPEGLTIGCLLPRADPRDVLIMRPVPGKTGDDPDTEFCDHAPFDQLPQAARVGSASLRRCAQLLHQRPDLDIRPLRGNINTRLDKLSQGTMDGILLAMAGLHRLGHVATNSIILDPHIMLPAAAQGVIGIACRTDDSIIRALLAPLHDRITEIAVTAERCFLSALEGDCRTPIAAYAHLQKNRLTFRGLLATPDGRSLWRAEQEGPPDQAIRMARDAAATIRHHARSAIRESTA